MGMTADQEYEQDREYLARRARRRKRWEQERRRRARRAFFIKVFAGLCAAGVIIAVCVKRAGRAPEEVVEENPVSAVAESESAGEETLPEQAEEAARGAVETDGQEEQEEPQSYRFESTADTVKIADEGVISSYAVLVDADADTIVAEKNAKDRISPASMTKVLTILVAAEAIDEEQLEDTFVMTREITDYAYVNDCSSVGFQDGESVKVRDLFYGAILASGGDAAVGLATYAAGSHEAFVDRMNQKLEELGIAESAHFTNCVGIYDENHYCTVCDMAVIMKAAMQNEWCRKVLSEHTYTTTPTAEHPEGIEISNWFLRRIEDKDTGGLVVGGKTGYVVQSGNCAVSYEECADGRAYICVTADSTSGWRCIYDHVEIYSRYIPNGKQKAETPSAEQEFSNAEKYQKSC